MPSTNLKEMIHISVSPQHWLTDCCLDLQQPPGAAVKPQQKAARSPPNPRPAPLQQQQQHQQQKQKLRNPQQKRDEHRRKRRRIPTTVSATR